MPDIPYAMGTAWAQQCGPRAVYLASQAEGIPALLEPAGVLLQSAFRPRAVLE